MKRRAFISVSDKTGIAEFAKELKSLGFEIVSTGGTEKTLKESGINVVNVSEITGFPECLDGRVKTLHPAVHAGILFIRDNLEHQRQVRELGIKPIDVVCVNLYPFKETVLNPDSTFEQCIENIDIGGPSMLRAAAKNHKDVVVVTDPADYKTVIEEYKSFGEVSYKTKLYLGKKVFEHTAAYDALIAKYLREYTNSGLPEELTLTFTKVQELRYGENPHQNAAFYSEAGFSEDTLPAAKQLNGKELSFNNINDANAAIELVKEFNNSEGLAVVAVKHTNPCGVGLANTTLEAYKKAYEADPVSIYGGIVATNGTVDLETAKLLKELFLEIIIAPSFTEEALHELKTKKNVRILLLEGLGRQQKPITEYDLKKVRGGLLIQDLDTELAGEQLQVVTKRQPTEKELEDMLFAMKVVKHIKSNGIVLAKDGVTCGIAPGQVNRIWAVNQAIDHAGESAKGSCLASDAFFPFDDCVRAAAVAGITAIIQPGGSIRDSDSIKAADELGIAMVFTGMRHFKH